MPLKLEATILLSAYHFHLFDKILLMYSIFMGNMDVPTQNNQPIKMPMGTYEFGANLVSSKVGLHSLLQADCLQLLPTQSCVGQHDDWANLDRRQAQRSHQVSRLIEL